MNKANFIFISTAGSNEIWQHREKWEGKRGKGKEKMKEEKGRKIYKNDKITG